MLLFFDTEFTGLQKETSLISIGIIDEDGNTFYAELNDYNNEQIDEWISENVIKNLEFNNVKEVRFEDGNDIRIKGSKEQVRDELIRWVGRYENVQFVSDVCHYDFVLLIDVFGTVWDIPKNVSPCCHDINQDIARYHGISEREAFDLNREEMIYGSINNIKKHNSLYDAIVIKYIYDGCEK